MISSANKRGLAIGLLAVLGAAYPFVVHAALGRVPAGALVLVGLTLVVVRAVLLKGSAVARPLLPPLATAALATTALAAVEPAMAAQAYPVLMSLAFAGAFGLSLLKGPSLVEIFASLTEPAPPPEARAYMCLVSQVWFVFLLLNASISAATAILGDTWLWALYNGLISYLLMGTLFAVEWLVRRRVRAHAEATR